MRDATLVLTVTPNPSLDLLFETDRLVWDDANRMADPRRRVGGQGINVTRAVRTLGSASTAVALLGGRTGAGIRAMLEDEATPLTVVEATAETRTFVAVRERGTGRSMLLNARGPDRSASDASRLFDATVAALAELRPQWLACCGSLPPGFPADFHARLAAAGRAAGARTVVDCDGEALRLAADDCDLLVPNAHEASRLLDTNVASPDDAAEAARMLVGRMRPGSRAAVTLGAGGAVLADSTGCWHACAPPLAKGSAVGAGDTFLAGLLVSEARTSRPGDALRLAVAAGAATLLSRGGDLLDGAAAEALLDQVVITESCRA
jgi:1-phosphofructokinase family hexose kinase